MKKRTNTPRFLRTLTRALLCAAAVCLAVAPAAAQQTAGGTPINNRASAVYFDSTGTQYEADSNTVTVVVANVSGLAVTPDDTLNNGGSGNVVAGNPAASVSFTVSNTGNFADTVTFKAGGASVSVSGAITAANVTEAFVDHDGNGNFTAGDVNIWTNGGDVTTNGNVAAGSSVSVVVKFAVPAGATGHVNVVLGDAGGASPFDNQTLVVSAADVANTTAGVNGRSEARGTRSLAVVRDAAIQTNLTAPAGPISPGSDVSYVLHTCNISPSQAASAVTLSNVVNGSNSGVFEILPIPNQTALKAGQTFPAGTLYSTSPLTDNPISAANWDGNAPGDLTTVRRIAFNRGASLAANNTCTADVTVLVTINASANANLPVLAIADSFARNTFNQTITDQSQDGDANIGNGRADLSPLNSNPDGSNLSAAGSVDGDGVLLLTLIAKVGDVYNGPNGAPRATGPSSEDDDFTNRSVTTGIAGRAPGENTNAAGTSTFTNTVENPGNADDVYTLSVTNFGSLPAGTSLVITTPSGSVTVNAGNPAGTVTISVPRGGTANYTVQFNLPTNQPVLTGFAATIRATSANTPTETNDTIDRLYTGFLRLDKTATVFNNTDRGNGQDDPGPDDAVPGAEILYSIRYENISTPLGTGVGSVVLTAQNITINEDGDAAPNDWAANTTQVVGANGPTITAPGTVTDGDTANQPVTAVTTYLKATIPSLAPGAFGTFTFRRLIN